MEIAGELAGATTTAALRSTVATLVLLVVLPLVGAKLPRRDVWPWAALTGLLIVTVAVDGQAEAVLRAGVATGAVLGTTAPFFILALGRLLFGNRFSAIGLAGMITGFAGVAIVITSQLGGDGPTDLTLGVVFAFVSAAAFALGTLIVKRLTERDPELDLVGLVTAQHIVGSAALIVLALIVDGTGETSWGSARLWGAIAWVGPGASALGFVAFLGAVRLLDAARAATWIFLVPVVAVLIEVVRGVVPGAVTIVGMALTIAGVGLASAAPEVPARGTGGIFARLGGRGEGGDAGRRG